MKFLLKFFFVVHLGVVLRGCGGVTLPHGLKFMHLLGRFEIFGRPLGLKHGTPVTLCVLLAYTEATVATEGYYICLGCKKDVNFCCL